MNKIKRESRRKSEWASERKKANGRKGKRRKSWRHKRQYAMHTFKSMSVAKNIGCFKGSFVAVAVACYCIKWTPFSDQNRVSCCVLRTRPHNHFIFKPQSKRALIITNELGKLNFQRSVIFKLVWKKNTLCVRACVHANWHSCACECVYGIDSFQESVTRQNKFNGIFQMPLHVRVCVSFSLLYVEVWLLMVWPIAR